MKHIINIKEYSAFRSTALNLQNKLTIESAIKNYYEENKEKKEETLQTLSISKVIKILNDREYVEQETI